MTTARRPFFIHHVLHRFLQLLDSLLFTNSFRSRNSKYKSFSLDQRPLWLCRACYQKRENPSSSEDRSKQLEGEASLGRPSEEEPLVCWRRKVHFSTAVNLDRVRWWDSPDWSLGLCSTPPYLLWLLSALALFMLWILSTCMTKCTYYMNQASGWLCGRWRTMGNRPVLQTLSSMGASDPWHLEKYLRTTILQHLNSVWSTPSIK